MSYDEKGHLTRETNPIGQEAIYKYDDIGNRVYTRNFSGRLETFCEYDFSNRLIKKEERRGMHGASESTYTNMTLKAAWFQKRILMEIKQPMFSMLLAAERNFIFLQYLMNQGP